MPGGCSPRPSDRSSTWSQGGSVLEGLWFRLRAWWRRDAFDAELDDELRFHLEQAMAKHLAAGVAPTEARRRARAALGSLGAIKDECRAAWGIRQVDALRHDLRYAARQLRRYPGLTLMAAASLAIGIGLNTTLFTMAEAVVWRSLAVAAPEGLVNIYTNDPQRERRRRSVLHELVSRLPRFSGWARDARQHRRLYLVNGCGGYGSRRPNGGRRAGFR